MHFNESDLHCPSCKFALKKLSEKKFICTNTVCCQTYSLNDDILSFFVASDKSSEFSDVTEKIKGFYEKNPFPNYDDHDDIGTLIDKAKINIFAKLLDDQIPLGASVLECGCGTGQLSNFLSIGNRKVIGTDICINSLRIASSFKEKMSLHNVSFLQMNLFKPCFKDESFDVVISNGVLHHTANPKLAYETISKLVKKNGYLIIGLYHKYGRLLNDARKVIYSLTGNNFLFLDRKRKSSTTSVLKNQIWFSDQYKNPHESKHTITEVINWIKEIDFEFVGSIPKQRIFDPILENEKIFIPQIKATRFELALHERLMTLTNSQDGGLFIVIAKKK